MCSCCRPHLTLTLAVLGEERVLVAAAPTSLTLVGLGEDKDSPVLRGCSSCSLSLLLHGLVAGLVVEHSVRWAGLSVGPSAHSGLSRSDPGSAVVQQMCHLRFRGVDFLPPGDSVETIGFS